MQMSWSSIINVESEKSTLLVLEPKPNYVHILRYYGIIRNEHEEQNYKITLFGLLMSNNDFKKVRKRTKIDEFTVLD